MKVAEFAFPGPLRDALVAAILRGEKVATSSLAVEYTDADPLPEVGDRELLVDSSGEGVAVIQTTAVDVVGLSTIDNAHARAEGEGFADATEWRLAHERFWRSDEYRAAIGDPEFDVDDGTQVVVQRFRVVERR